MDSAVRELEEELGLSVSTEAMARAFVCILPSQAVGETATHGRFVCREFQCLYVLRVEDCIPDGASAASFEDQLTLGAGEVSGVALMDAEVVRRAWASADESFVPRAPHYVAALLAALEEL